MCGREDADRVRYDRVRYILLLRIDEGLTLVLQRVRGRYDRARDVVS